MRVLKSRSTSIGNTLTSTPAMLLLPIRESYVHAYTRLLTKTHRGNPPPLRMRISAHKKVDSHRASGDDHKYANPALRQALRIVSSEITTNDGAQSHHR